MRIGWSILGVFYLCAGLIYLHREIRFIWSTRDLLLISYARLLYCATGGFIPALMCFMYAFFGIKVRLHTLVAVDYSYDGLFYLYLLWFSSVLCYIMLNTGYRTEFRFTFSGKTISRNPPLELSELQTLVTGGICLVVGIVCLTLWTKNEGNIFNFIVKANWYRADYTNSQNNAYAMMKIPAKLVQIAAYIFFFQMIQYRCKHKVLFSMGYGLALAASVLYLLATDGRLAIVMFFAIQLIGFILYRHQEINLGKKEITILVTLCLIALVLIAKMDDITNYIRYGRLNTNKAGDSSGIFVTLMSEFGYIYESGQKAIEHVLDGGQWMMANDIVRGAFSILPSKFTPDGFERVWRYNTFLCTGSWSAGTIPCDIVAESIYNMGFLGILILPLFWGLVIRMVENIYTERKDLAFNRAMYMCFALAFFRIIGYCEFYDFFRELFAAFCGIIVSLVVRRVDVVIFHH